MAENYKREGDALIQILIDKIDKLDSKLDKHMEGEEGKIGELIETFNTAKHVIWFIKWVGVLVGALGMTWAWLHNHFTLGVK